MKLDREKAARLLLRSGLAFVFLFAAYTSLTHPENYYIYVPGFVAQIVPIKLFLDLYGVFEVLLAIWLLSGKLVFFAALIAAILLFTLTFFNLIEINTLFRNVAIITAALALAALSTPFK